jgi:protein TonB
MAETMSAAGGVPLGYTPKKPATGIVVVLTLHLLLGWALVSGLAQRVVEVVRSPIQTKLVEEIKPPPPPPPPDLPKPTVTPPAAVQVPVPVVIPQVTPPPAAVQAPPPPVAPPPVAAAPPPPDAIRAPAPPPPIPAPPPATTAKATPDALYTGGLRVYLNSIKKYPTSREARQLRPQGTVRLKLEIDRAGQLLNAVVETTSGSLLLDNEALRTVRNGRFPPIPADAFVGQASNTFIFSMEYLHEGG